MPEQASVTVFLFTDIEGSTRLWERSPDAMRDALERHDAIAAAAVESHRGRIVKTTGDGVHAVFADPLDAVNAAIAMQLALAASDAAVTLRVRAGLHVGVESERANDFYGTSVNRAARIMSAAHGEQILASDAVAALVHDRLAPGVSLRPLGRVRLRDLSEPEAVHQVVHPDLRAEFPALRSLESTPNNLPQSLTSFIGREKELADVRGKLSSTRLLTIFGIGGLGKSRLSLQAAAASLDHFPDGVWFVELAPIADPRMVAQAVATVLGIRDDAGQSPHDAIMKFVRDRKLLVVLDNCEHVTQACAELARGVLQSGSGVTILATSRERLGIAGEQTYPLAPFAVPPDAPIAPIALGQFASVQLLSERALSARPDFTITVDNAKAIASICHQLDGIPLALELAAARVRSMSVQRIAERLSDRFKLLSTGDRTALPRQQTLRALIDWSYELLSTEEQSVFRRLAVFAGGFSLAAAETVASGDTIAGEDVQDLVTQLVEKSLVVFDAQHDRYSMLETVRQYASAHLESTADADGVRARHLSFYLALCERAAPELIGSAPARWLEMLDREHENVLAAHAHCNHAAEGGVVGLRLARAMRGYFFRRGLMHLGMTTLLEALRRKGAQQRDLLRCRVLSDAGQYALRMGNNSDALRHLEESLAIAREIHDDARIAIVLQPIGRAHLALGDTATAHRYLQEAMDRASRGGDRREIAAAMSTLEQLHRCLGDLVTAERVSREVLAMQRDLGDRLGIGVALLNVATIAIQRRDASAAEALLREAVAIDSEVGGTPLGQALLETAAGLADLRGEFAQAARFYGAAEAQAAHSGIRRDPADATFVVNLADNARRSLGDVAFDREILEGGALGTERAMLLLDRWLGRRA